MNWESFRCDHESEDQWALKKKFLELHKDNFEEDRLVSLSKLFYNVNFLGCRYPKKTMELIEELSNGIIEEYNQNSRLKRHLVPASIAVVKKIKGYSSASNNEEETETSDSVTNNIQPVISLIEFVKPTYHDENTEEPLKIESDTDKVENKTLNTKKKCKGNDKLQLPLSSENVGYKILVKMGWNEKGLGKQEQGIQEPISAGISQNKRKVGLGFEVKTAIPHKIKKKKKNRKTNCAKTENLNTIYSCNLLTALGSSLHYVQDQVNTWQDFNGLIIFERYYSEDLPEGTIPSVITLEDSFKQFDPPSLLVFKFATNTEDSFNCEILLKNKVRSSANGSSQMEAKSKAAAQLLDNLQQHFFTIKEKNGDRCEICNKDLIATDGKYYFDMSMVKGETSQETLPRNKLFSRLKGAMRDYATSGSEYDLDFSRHTKDLEAYKKMIGQLMKLAKIYKLEGKIKRNSGKIEQFTVKKKTPCLYLLLKKLKTCGGEDAKYLIIPPKIDKDLIPSTEGLENIQKEEIVEDCQNSSEANITSHLPEEKTIEAKLEENISEQSIPSTEGLENIQKEEIVEDWQNYSLTEVNITSHIEKKTIEAKLEENISEQSIPSTEGLENIQKEEVVEDWQNSSLTEVNITSHIAEEKTIERKLVKNISEQRQDKFSNRLNVWIIADDFPATILTREQMLSVEEALVDRIFKNQDTNVTPQYLCSSHQDGFLVVSCQDVETAEWTKKQVVDLKIWENTVLNALFEDSTSEEVIKTNQKKKLSGAACKAKLKAEDCWDPIYKNKQKMVKHMGIVHSVNRSPDFVTLTTNQTQPKLKKKEMSGAARRAKVKAEGRWDPFYKEKQTNTTTTGIIHSVNKSLDFAPLTTERIQQKLKKKKLSGAARRAKFKAESRWDPFYKEKQINSNITGFIQCINSSPEVTTLTSEQSEVLKLKEKKENLSDIEGIKCTNTKISTTAKQSDMRILKKKMSTADRRAACKAKLEAKGIVWDPFYKKKQKIATNKGVISNVSNSQVVPTTNSIDMVEPKTKKRKTGSTADQEAACKAKLEDRGIVSDLELYKIIKKPDSEGIESVSNISRSMAADVSAPVCSTKGMEQLELESKKSVYLESENTASNSDLYKQIKKSDLGGVKTDSLELTEGKCADNGDGVSLSGTSIISDGEKGVEFS